MSAAKELGARPAHPMPLAVGPFGDVFNGFENMHPDFHGLTIRQQFAMAAMQGFAADPAMAEAQPPTIAKYAFEWADAMLAEAVKDQP